MTYRNSQSIVLVDNWYHPHAEELSKRILRIEILRALTICQLIVKPSCPRV